MQTIDDDDDSRYHIIAIRMPVEACHIGGGAGEEAKRMHALGGVDADKLRRARRRPVQTARAERNVPSWRVLKK